MNFKQKLRYTCLGATIMLIGMFASHLLVPITAQDSTSSQDAFFNEVTCGALSVVDNDGKEQIRIDTFGGLSLITLGKGPSRDDGIALTSFRGRSEVILRGVGHEIRISASDKDADMKTSGKSNVFRMYGPQNRQIVMSCNEDDAVMQLSGGYEGKKHIKLSTTIKPIAVNPKSVEGGYFGIPLYDTSKSDYSRANMLITRSGIGGFSAFSSDDLPLWSSSAR